MTMSIRRPTGVLFAPNFLINTEYRTALGAAHGFEIDSVAVPCRLRAEAGFVRGWFARVNGLQTTPNVRPTEAGERGHAINGVLVAFYGDRLLEPADDGGVVRMDPAWFEPVGWQALPPADLPIGMFVVWQPRARADEFSYWLTFFRLMTWP